MKHISFIATARKAGESIVITIPHQLQLIKGKTYQFTVKEEAIKKR